MALILADPHPARLPRENVAVDVPVIAAGGIGTARGLAAALAAGAARVRMGTRFTAAAESSVHPGYRDALIAASSGDSVLTDEYSEGWPHEQTSSRVLRSSIEAARVFEGDLVGEIDLGGASFPQPRFTFIPPVPQFNGAVETLPMYAGESVRFVRRWTRPVTSSAPLRALLNASWPPGTEARRPWERHGTAAALNAYGSTIGSPSSSQLTTPPSISVTSANPRSANMLIDWPDRLPERQYTT